MFEDSFIVRVERERERERFMMGLKSIILTVTLKKGLYLLIKFIILQVFDCKHSILVKYHNKCLATYTS